MSWTGVTCFSKHFGLLEIRLHQQSRQDTLFPYGRHTLKDIQNSSFSIYSILISIQEKKNVHAEIFPYNPILKIKFKMNLLSFFLIIGGKRALLLWTTCTPPFSSSGSNIQRALRHTNSCLRFCPLARHAPRRINSWIAVAGSAGAPAKARGFLFFFCNGTNDLLQSRTPRRTSEDGLSQQASARLLVRLRSCRKRKESTKTLSGRIANFESFHFFQAQTTGPSIAANLGRGILPWR